MIFSFAMGSHRLTGAQSHPIHALAHRSPRFCNATLQFSAVPQRALEPLEATSVCYRGTVTTDKIRLDSTSPHRDSGEISMVITAAHIQPIVALLAGILILIMPRFLNLVVAIYLICVGLIGLGVLKWLHM
jgi:hypothetical protein